MEPMEVDRTPLKDVSNNFNLVVVEENEQKENATPRKSLEEMLNDSEDVIDRKAGGDNSDIRSKPNLSILSTFDPLYTAENTATPDEEPDQKKDVLGSDTCTTTSCRLLDITHVIECKENVTPDNENTESHEKKCILDQTCIIATDDNKERDSLGDLQSDKSNENSTETLKEADSPKQEEVAVEESSNSGPATQTLIECVMTDTVEKPPMPEQVTKKSEEANQDTIVALKMHNAKLQSECDQFKKILEEYDISLAAKSEDLKKLMEENDIVKGHLAAIEMAFSDLLQKYERCKTIVQGYKQNEDTMRHHLQTLEDTLQKNEEKYETLKTHAKTQLERASQEIRLLRASHDAEVAKCTALIKRLEIKYDSTVQALDQKTKECSSMAALFDEMTGKM